MSGEAEPRRSVRATKGQHTKAFDEIEPVAAPKRRQSRKSKKALEQEQEQEPDEVIRCVCGATEQDEDSAEAWISCEECYVWQHNVCVGVSSFEDEIPENYWCEQCRPQDHKELLEGIERGEEPWEERRKAHEILKAERRKKKGGRRSKGKRHSDAKSEPDKDTGRNKSNRASPAPEAANAKDKDKKDGASKMSGKRKLRDEPLEDGKSAKVRRVSEKDGGVPSTKYTPPADLSPSILELPGARVGPAKALKKSLTFILTAMVKNKQLTLSKGETEEEMAEKYALQIERAVFETHPLAKGHKEYNQQIKTLSFNLKNNAELFPGLLNGAHTPATLAVMTSEQLASSEMQRQTAEMRARAEKQSILYTQDTGPRVRRTHKGEELVIEDDSNVHDAPIPSSGGPRRSGEQRHQEAHLVKRESTSGETSDAAKEASVSRGDERSPSQPDFDINKVFSTVKSPVAGHSRRPSAPKIKTGGPGIDPDVDRMLEDDDESIPYSPTEEDQDPGIVWRGPLAMTSVSEFEVKAKHIGGCDFGKVNGPWTELMPSRLTVAGRIKQQSAIEYLCSLRYSAITDVVVVSLTPTSASSREDFGRMVDYFLSKERYGVVGDKAVGNVRDTYLVPVAAGEGGHPEFMMNLMDNYIPKTRTEPMLLAVFVYRCNPDQMRQGRERRAAASPQLQSQQQDQQQQQQQQQQSTRPSSASASASATPTPSTTPGYSGGHAGARSASISGPVFSPATPQAPSGAFPPPQAAPQQQQASATAAQSGNSSTVQHATPVPVPPIPLSYRAGAGPAAAQGSAPTPPSTTTTAAAAQQLSEEELRRRQREGEALAHEVLGDMAHQADTMRFLLPQAFQMSRREWEVVRDLFQREPRAQHDLQHLGRLLAKHAEDSSAS